jgi:uncharacterized protein YbaA (DUF1428 family)
MSYFDVMVASVPTDKKDEYRKNSQEMSAVFMEHGAQKLVDCWGDDVPDGKLTSFPMAVKCEPGETVVVGWIQWPSKEVRDRGMEAAMKDPRMSPDSAQPPFDGKRMIFGGFELLSEA